MTEAILRATEFLCLSFYVLLCSLTFSAKASLQGRVFLAEAAYLIRAAMVPLLDRHFSWVVASLPVESYSQLLSEAHYVQLIWCPLIVSEAG